MNRLAAAVAGTLALLVVAASAQTPTPAPHPTYGRLRSARSRDDTTRLILDYGRAMRLQFDTAQGAGDEQRLTVGDCDTSCSLGPLAAIQPRLRRPNWESPPRDSGEIIARIISDGPYMGITGTDTVYKFNIRGRDTVYWWVGPREGRLVSIFSSTQAIAPLVSDLDPGAGHSRSFWKQGLARWVWTPHDEKAWGTCDGGRCCSSAGLSILSK